jgi:hypothetical protein
LSDQKFILLKAGKQIRSVAAMVDLLPGVLAMPGSLAVELFAITTVANAAATAVAEKIFFGRHFKLLKVEY